MFDKISNEFACYCCVLKGNSIIPFVSHVNFKIYINDWAITPPDIGEERVKWPHSFQHGTHNPKMG